MADTKISALPDAGALTGAEVVPVLTAGVNERTTAATIAALSGITQLTGDVTAGPGTGSQAATLANTAVSPGSYKSTNLTVDAKGRITAAASGGWELAASWTFSIAVANVDFTNLAAFNEIMLLGQGITLSAIGQTSFRASTDNGATFLNTSGNYISITPAGVAANATSISLHTTGATAARSWLFHVFGWNLTTAPKPARTGKTDLPSYVINTNSALNALRIFSDTGSNLTAGTIHVFGK